MNNNKNDGSTDRNTGSQNSRAEENGFPGYPHYPSGDDITNPEHGNKKVSTDVESLGNSRRLSPEADSEQRVRVNESVPEDDSDDLGIVAGTEADVTADDLILLGDRQSDQDMGEDETDSQRSGLDRIDEDIDEEESLDVPGAELDDKDEDVGDEDEENNYYSLGGENHEAQEEDQQ
jgi:hypothetical protein